MTVQLPSPLAQPMNFFLVQTWKVVNNVSEVVDQCSLLPHSDPACPWKCGAMKYTSGVSTTPNADVCAKRVSDLSYEITLPCHDLEDDDDDDDDGKTILYWEICGL